MSGNHIWINIQIIYSIYSVLDRRQVSIIVNKKWKGSGSLQRKQGKVSWNGEFGRDLEGEIKCEDERADGRKPPLEETPKAQKVQDASQQ